MYLQQQLVYWKTDTFESNKTFFLSIISLSRKFPFSRLDSPFWERKASRCSKRRRSFLSRSNEPRHNSGAVTSAAVHHACAFPLVARSQLSGNFDGDIGFYKSSSKTKKKVFQFKGKYWFYTLKRSHSLLTYYIFFLNDPVFLRWKDEKP